MADSDQFRGSSQQVGGAYSNGLQAEEAPANASNDVNKSVHALLCKLVGPTAARMLREHIKECSRHDENSIVYKQAFLAWVELRVAANMPIEVARLLHEWRHDANNIVQQFRTASRVTLSESASQMEETVFAPERQKLLGHHPRVGKQTRLYRLRERNKLWLTQHLWLSIGAIILMALVYGVAVSHYEKSKAESWKQQEIVRMHSQEEVSVQDEHLRVLQEVLEQIEQFKELKPATRRLALELEKTARHVQMTDGKLAWEFTLTEEAGLLEWDASSVSSPKSLQLYIGDKSR